MFYRSFFPRDIFSEFDRLQDELSQNLGFGAPIRGGLRGYPAMNVGATQKSVEVYVFTPGVSAQDLHVQIEKGVLTISGERKPDDVPAGATVHMDERFSGKFRRAVSLPDDADPDTVSASYRDGVLHISVARKEAAQPRRVTIQ